MAIDGDTLSLGGERIRLHGIDAPESQQTCTRRGDAWHCGQDATGLLASTVNGKTVLCRQRDVDSYRRIVATCTVNGLDLGQAMVEAGLAVALPQFSQAYVEAEARVRRLGIGIWGSQFDVPSDYRAAHPQLAPPPVTRHPPPRQMPESPVGTRRQSEGVFYRNCAAAWAAGAAPIYFGQPGYRPEMDGDGDGVACEPYRRRR